MSRIEMGFGNNGAFPFASNPLFKEEERDIDVQFLFMSKGDHLMSCHSWRYHS